MKKTRHKWTVEDDTQLERLYSNLSNNEIGGIMRMTSQAVQSRAERLRLKKSDAYRQSLNSFLGKEASRKNRVHTVNHNYFEDIDSPEKAYWYGWMWSDGYVRHATHGRNNSYVISLEIQKRDRWIVERFRQSIESTHNLYERGERKSIRLEFASKQMFNDLMTLGVVPRKSYGDKTPVIDDCLLSHFIRGVFDGDGSIATGVPNIGIVGTKSTCFWLKSTLDRRLRLDSKVYKKKPNLYGWRINKPDRILFSEFLYYQSENLRLERKYVIFRLHSLI